MSNVVLNILSEFKGKAAFKQADTAVTRLEKSAKKLGAALGVSLGTAAVVAFGKASVKAFTEDQKAAAQLSNTVKNLGLSFADADIQKFIEQLSLASGVVDDQLRPAMQKLLQVTGSVAKSQDLLKKSIDISRGSGVDLVQVSNDLAQAYVGNLKGLKKYNLGLTQAELKTASFDKVLAAFNKNFQGASAAYLETYAGKIERLTTAAGEAKEKLGGALIDSAMLISGSKGIDDLISKINSLTDSTIGWIDRLSEGVALIKTILNSNVWDMSKNIDKVLVESYNQKLRRNYMKAWEGVDIPKTPQQTAAAKAAEAAAAKRAKELAAAQAKQTKALKDQAALKKANSVFDQKNIELTAALMGKLRDEEANRVKALLALNNDNADAAKYYTDLVIKAQDATGQLAMLIRNLPAAKNPFENFYLNPATMTIAQSVQYTNNATAAADLATQQALNALATLDPISALIDKVLNNNSSTTEWKITGEGPITNAIASGLQQSSLSTGNVSTINRRTGGFE